MEMALVTQKHETLTLSAAPELRRQNSIALPRLNRMASED